MRGNSREVRWVLEEVGEGERARHPRGPFVVRQRVWLCDEEVSRLENLLTSSEQVAPPPEARGDRRDVLARYPVRLAR